MYGIYNIYIWREFGAHIIGIFDLSITSSQMVDPISVLVECW